MRHSLRPKRDPSIWGQVLGRSGLPVKTEGTRSPKCNMIHVTSQGEIVFYPALFYPAQKLDAVRPATIRVLEQVLQEERPPR